LSSAQKKQKPLWLLRETLTPERPQHKRIDIIFRTDKLNIRAGYFQSICEQVLFFSFGKEAYVF
jgi:hypothetical protein